MLKNIYSMYDRAVKAYMQPIFHDSTGGIIRGLTDVLEDREHQFTKHPEDYTLFKLGTFDEITGKIEYHEPEKVIGVWELKSPEVKQPVLSEEPITV
jgi:hypothetical protein